MSTQTPYRRWCTPLGLGLSRRGRQPLQTPHRSNPWCLDCAEFSRRVRRPVRGGRMSRQARRWGSCHTPLAISFLPLFCVHPGFMRSLRGLRGRRGLRHIALAGHAILEVGLPVAAHGHRPRSLVGKRDIGVAEATLGYFSARSGPRTRSTPGWAERERSRPARWARLISQFS